jgi:hypothetical protein
MSYPEKNPEALAAIHERIFGERNRDVTEARAQVMDAARGVGDMLRALDELERAVQRRTSYDLRKIGRGDAADLVDQAAESAR